MKPRIGKLSIYEVRRSHVNKMLDEIEDANGPVMADRTLPISARPLIGTRPETTNSTCRSCAGWRGSSQRSVPARASCPMRNPHHLAGPRRGWDFRCIGQGAIAYGAAAG